MLILLYCFTFINLDIGKGCVGNFVIFFNKTEGKVQYNILKVQALREWWGECGLAKTKSLGKGPKIKKRESMVFDHTPQNLDQK